MPIEVPSEAQIAVTVNCSLSVCFFFFSFLSLPRQIKLTAERNGFAISWRKVSVGSARACKLK